MPPRRLPPKEYFSLACNKSRQPVTNRFEAMNHSERERMFEELFRRHKAPIQRLCFAYLSSAGEVEDLFQEIMSNVWNALPKFRGEAQAATWLYRIAVNTALLY